MAWRDEMDRFTFDRDNVTKSYIKDELKKYYLYIEGYMSAKNDLYLLGIKYGDYLENPVNTTSFIKVGDKPTESKNRVVEWEGEIQETKDRIQELEKKLDELDSWLDSLSETQRAVVKNYVCMRGCTNSNEVATELVFTQQYVYRVTKMAIEHIYTTFFEKSVHKVN